MLPHAGGLRSEASESVLCSGMRTNAKLHKVSVQPLCLACCADVLRAASGTLNLGLLKAAGVNSWSLVSTIRNIVRTQPAASACRALLQSIHSETCLAELEGNAAEARYI